MVPRSTQAQSWAVRNGTEETPIGAPWATVLPWGRAALASMHDTLVLDECATPSQLLGGLQGSVLGGVQDSVCRTASHTKMVPNTRAYCCIGMGP